MVSDERLLAGGPHTRTMEILLHAGHEHPATLWIAVSAVLSFVLGVGVGAFGVSSATLSNEQSAGGGENE